MNYNRLHKTIFCFGILFCVTAASGLSVSGETLSSEIPLTEAGLADCEELNNKGASAEESAELTNEISPAEESAELINEISPAAAYAEEASDAGPAYMDDFSALPVETPESSDIPDDTELLSAAVIKDEDVFLAESSLSENSTAWGNCTVYLPASVVYDGTRAEPAVTVKAEDGTELQKDIDYTVAYHNHSHPGTGKITLTGLSELCTGEISLDFRITLSAPKMVSVKSTGYQSIKASWRAVPGAETYTLYYKADGESEYKKLKGGLKETAYIHHSGKGAPLVTGRKYQYTVQAVYKKVKSEKAKGLFAVPKPGTAKVTSVKPVSYNSVLISWSQVEGATGYCVYYKNGGGSWKKLGSVKQSTTFLFTGNHKKPIRTGVRYQYSVRAFRKINGETVFGDYAQKTKSAKTIPEKVKLVGIDCLGKDRVDIWWRKAEGADCYVIYRMNTAGEWVEIARVSEKEASHYVHSSSGKFPIKNNYTYRYTVRAMANNGNTLGKYDKKGLKVVIHDLTASEIRAKIYARRIVNSITNENMSNYEKLVACFNWAKEHPFRSDHIISYQKGWTGDFANDIFEKGSGECIAYGASFAYLAKALGYNNVRVATTSRPNPADIHGWAEIGGMVYDPSLARHVGNQYFFHITYQAFGYDIGAAQEIY